MIYTRLGNEWYKEMFQEKFMAKNKQENDTKIQNKLSKLSFPPLK